jgi:hypothetical protein
MKRFERVKQILEEGVSGQTSETIKDKPTERLIGHGSIDIPHRAVQLLTGQLGTLL